MQTWEPSFDNKCGHFGSKQQVIRMQTKISTQTVVNIHYWSFYASQWPSPRVSRSNHRPLQWSSNMKSSKTRISAFSLISFHALPSNPINVNSNTQIGLTKGLLRGKIYIYTSDNNKVIIPMRYNKYKKWPKNISVDWPVKYLYSFLSNYL